MVRCKCILKSSEMKTITMYDVVELVLGQADVFLDSI